MLHNLCIDVSLIDEANDKDFDLGVYNLPVSHDESNRKNNKTITFWHFHQNIVMFVE